MWYKLCHFHIMKFPTQIETTGLEVKETVLHDNHQAWSMFEEVYGANVIKPNEGFYVFLQKKPQD